MIPPDGVKPKLMNNGMKMTVKFSVSDDGHIFLKLGGVVINAMRIGKFQKV